MGGSPRLHGRFRTIVSTRRPSSPLGAQPARRAGRPPPALARRASLAGRSMDPAPPAPPRRPRRQRGRRRRVRLLADRPAAGQGPRGVHAERREPRLRRRRRVPHRVPGGEAHLRAAPADPARPAQRHHRRRGRALLLALRRRRPRHQSGRLRELPPRPGRRGRQHDHPAARQGPLPHPGPELLPQDEGGAARLRAGEAVLEGPAAGALPEPGVHGPRRLRGRGGGAHVLRQVGRRPHPARGVAPGRAPALPRQLFALRAPRAGPAAAGYRGRPPARARVHRRGRGEDGQPRAARPRRARTPPRERAILPRVPPAEPRGEVRERRPLQERARRLHHAGSGPPAGGGAGAPGRASGARRCDRRRDPATKPRRSRPPRRPRGRSW